MQWLLVIASVLLLVDAKPNDEIPRRRSHRPQITLSSRLNVGSRRNHQLVQSAGSRTARISLVVDPAKLQAPQGPYLRDDYKPVPRIRLVTPPRRLRTQATTAPTFQIVGQAPEWEPTNQQQQQDGEPVSLTITVTGPPPPPSESIYLPALMI